MKIKTKNRLIAAFAFTAIVGASVGVATLANSGNAALDGGFGLHGNYSLTAFAEGTTAKKITVAGKLVDVTDTMVLNSTDGAYKLCVTAIDTADLEGVTGTTVGYDYDGAKYNGTGSGLTNAVYSSLTIRTGEDSSRIVTPAQMKGVTADFTTPRFVVAEFQSNGVEATAKLEVNAEYDIMENLPTAWGWSDNNESDLSKQNEGILTHTSGDTQWVSSKDSYDSVAITATVVSGGFRQGVFIRFKGDSYANDKYVMIQKEKNGETRKISWNGENNIWGNGSNLCGDWTEYETEANMSAEDIAAIQNGTYELTLVRNKNEIHVFINGKYYDTKTLDASYANEKCCVGIYCTNASEIIGKERKFRIEDASKYTVPETNISVTGIGLNNSPVDMNGKEVIFTKDGTSTRLAVANGKVMGELEAGTYTVSCEGFYGLTATVDESGANLAFEKEIFAYNLINEPESNMGDKSNVGSSRTAASEGVIKAIGDGKIYEWTKEQYKDVAITLTLKSGNGNQGIVMRFNGEQKDVRLRFENTKAQWMGNAWFWGTMSIIDRWDFKDNGGENYANPMSQTLLDKYNGEGLTLTLVRKGGMAYALIDGTIYSAQIISGYATADARIAVFAEDAKNGYKIPFEISTDVDAILNEAKDPHNVLSVLGKWTVTDTTLAATGDSYAEFAPAEVATKESLKIKIAAKNSNAGKKAQGLVYRFDDGKWLAARIESSADGTYIQYSADPLLFNDGGFLKNWTLIHDLTDEEKTAFDGDGIELQMVRDGKCIHVLLGGKVIDTVTLGNEYATMDGVIAATIEQGTGTAYAYEYKSGDGVTIPGYSQVNASFEGGNAYGYELSLDKNIVETNGKVTLTIKTVDSRNVWVKDNNGVWKEVFPTKITVNGVDTNLTVADFVSNGANMLTCTKELTITEDTVIKVTVAEGVDYKYKVKTSVDGVGGTISSDSGEDGYYWNDSCVLTITPDDGYELESLTINGTAVTGLTKGEDGKYTYNLPDTITEEQNIVVKFKAAA